MDVDVVIVGAGFAELCMLQHTQSMGLSARVFEQGGGAIGSRTDVRYPKRLERRDPRRRAVRDRLFAFCIVKRGWATAFSVRRHCRRPCRDAPCDSPIWGLCSGHERHRCRHAPRLLAEAPRC
jgi:hypothetical protein